MRSSDPRTSLPSASSVGLALPRIAGVGIELEDGRRLPRRPSSATFRNRASHPTLTTSMLTPSMAQIADHDVVVDLRGFPTPPAFKVGGRQGNVVTKSMTNSVHRGWRLVAIDGRRIKDMREMPTALAAAQQRGRYSVTFRIGEQPEENGIDMAAAAREAAARLAAAAEAEAFLQRQAAEEAQRMQLEMLEAERWQREREEAQRRRRAEDEARRRKEVEEEEAERLRQEEEARGLAEAKEAEEEAKRLRQAEELKRQIEAELKRAEEFEAERIRRAEEEEEVARQEAERLRLEAEARQRQEAEAAQRQCQEEEAERKRLEGEEQAKRLLVEAEEAEHVRLQEETRRRHEAAEEAERKRQKEEAECHRLAEEEAQRKAAELAEVERQRRLEVEAERKRREAEETRKKRHEAEEAELQLREAEEVSRRQREAEHTQRKLREAEEAERQRREVEELNRKRIVAEDERKRREAEDAERKRSKEKEELKKEAEVKVERKAVEKKLQKATGLPPREKVQEPQKALMAALTAPSKVPAKPNGPCDKCDGKHDTNECPHFKKSRDKHDDATRMYGKKGEDSESGQWPVLRHARVVAQPGDGSCLFHSLSHGLQSTNASRLRAEIADYIAANPDSKVADNPIKDWVLWDTGMDTTAYSRAMRTGSQWGGAVEMALCAKLKRMHVHVYERGKGGFKRISSFEGDVGQGAGVINLLYGGRVHYDALEI